MNEFHKAGGLSQLVALGKEDEAQLQNFILRYTSDSFMSSGDDIKNVDSGDFDGFRLAALMTFMLVLFER